MTKGLGERLEAEVQAPIRAVEPVTGLRRSNTSPNQDPQARIGSGPLDSFLFHHCSSLFLAIPHESRSEMAPVPKNWTSSGRTVQQQLLWQPGEGPQQGQGELITIG